MRNYADISYIFYALYLYVIFKTRKKFLLSLFRWCKNLKRGEINLNGEFWAVQSIKQTHTRAPTEEEKNISYNVCCKYKNETILQYMTDLTKILSVGINEVYS